MALASGTRLGPYEVLRPLGAGGMGEVYVARDTRLDRSVAVKVLPAQVADDAAALARFEREAKAIAALSHPNILAIFDVGREQGVSYVVTEILDGETLRERLGLGAIAPSKAIGYATQLAEGLAAAHGRGIVHRDIKPENVFITHDGRVKLLDFGLARSAEGEPSGTDAETRVAATAAHTVMGTVGYMSPEQARGERAEATSDVFSFGVVLHEMLSGRRAFEGRTAIEVLSAVLRDDPPPLSQSGVHVSPRLERIVRRCLEKSPHERFQSARDLAFSLSTSLDGEDAPPRKEARSELSIVVLPFVNLSPDPDDAFLADGFTEEAISDLSSVRSLRVISRTSAMRLKGSDKDAATIAHELDVQYVLEGSVRRSGDSLRVTARLVDADGDRQLWTDRYTGVAHDIFSIQEQVARGIVEALHVRLTRDERQALGSRQITDLRAYESYLRARSAMWGFSLESVRSAQKHLENALALVGDNELLLATLGHAHLAHAYAGATVAFDRVDECIERIARLNPASPHAVSLRGLRLFHGGDLRAALPELERARQLLPDDPDVLVILGYLLSLRGQSRDASALFAALLRLDPLTPVNQGMPGFDSVMQGAFEQATSSYARLMEMDPENPMALFGNAWWRLHEGRLAEAEPYVERLAHAHPSSPYVSVLRAELAGLRGARDEAYRAITPEVVTLASHNELWSRELTHCHALAGRIDEALRWFENTVRIGTINYPFWSRHDRMLDSLRQDARFHEILARVREEWAQGVSSEEAARYPLQEFRPAVVTTAPSESRIAVLPFANLSPDPDTEYFADGVSEEIINVLTNVPELHVIARTSAFVFKGTNTSLREIGRQLDVGTVLEGSVRRAGRRLRITTKLVDVATARPVWSEQYDRELDDVFAIQDEIAQAVARRLSPAHTAPAIRERGTASLEAYEAYLRGRFFEAKGTPGDFATSVRHYERAIALDTDYAKAHGGLASALFFWALVAQGPELMRRARGAADRALALDGDLAESHATLSYIRFMGEWDWSGSIAAAERALALSPGLASASAIVLTNLGRADEAVELARRAVAFDPMSARALQSLQFCLHQAGMNEESLELGARALELSPEFLMAHFARGQALLELARLDEAEGAFRAMLPILADEPMARAGLVLTLVRLGRRREAEDLTRSLETRPGPAGGQVGVSGAWAHAALGNFDSAFAWIERAIAGREPFLVCLPSFCWWDPLRSDPRFEPLLRRLRFPDWSIDVSRDRERRYRGGQRVPVSSTTPVAAMPPGASIAVLPFVNLSPDPENEYFSDGLTEELIADLSKIGSLRVISRHSSRRLKGTDKDLQTIGRELGVRYLLEGSVRKAGNSLRITAQLVSAPDDAQVWADKYSGTLDDVFDIQERVSREIVKALHLTLSPNEARRVSERPIADATAYEYYLRARQETYRFTREGVDRALTLLTDALRIAGDNALLYATLGMAYWQNINAGLEPDERFLQQAEECAVKVFALVPDSAEGHCLRGVTLISRGKPEAAASSLKTALSLDPDHRDALFWRGAVLGLAGRDCSAEADRLLEIDPLTPLNLIIPAWNHLMHGRFREALDVCRRWQQADRSNPLAELLFAEMLVRGGEMQEGRAVLAQLADRDQQSMFGRLALFLTLAFDGNTSEALQTIDAPWAEQARWDPQYSWEVAGGLALLGERALAIDWLRNATERCFINYPFLAELDPLLANIRGEPSFTQLMDDVRPRWERFEI